MVDSFGELTGMPRYVLRKTPNPESDVIRKWSGAATNYLDSPDDFAEYRKLVPDADFRLCPVIGKYAAFDHEGLSCYDLGEHPDAPSALADAELRLAKDSLIHPDARDYDGATGGGRGLEPLRFWPVPNFTVEGWHVFEVENFEPLSDAETGRKGRDSLLPGSPEHDRMLAYLEQSAKDCFDKLNRGEKIDEGIDEGH